MQKIATKTVFLPGRDNITFYCLEGFKPDEAFTWFSSQIECPVEREILIRKWPRDDLQKIKDFADWFNPKYEARLHQARLFLY